MIFAAHELGFSPEAEFRDQTQMQFVALVVRPGASRLILTSGMAMRALYGSTRLTPRPTASEAAGIIRTGAIVSLQTVLGEAGITNKLF